VDSHCLPFSDAQFDETAFKEQVTGDQAATMVCLYWIVKLKTRCLSGDYAEALVAADKASRAARENGFVQNEGLVNELAAPRGFHGFDWQRSPGNPRSWKSEISWRPRFMVRLLKALPASRCNWESPGSK
jgi:hypothetical protein